MKYRRYIFFVLSLLIFFVVGIYLFNNYIDKPTVTNFEECEQAGYPVMESYPRQCAADGVTYIEDVENEVVINEDDTDGDNPEMANPASVYCEENGGEVDIRTESDGSQTGYCVFSDGSECEEWAYYNGECEPSVE